MTDNRFCSMNETLPYNEFQQRINIAYVCMYVWVLIHNTTNETVLMKLK